MKIVKGWAGFGATMFDVSVRYVYPFIKFLLGFTMDLSLLSRSIVNARKDFLWAKKK